MTEIRRLAERVFNAARYGLRQNRAEIEAVAQFALAAISPEELLPRSSLRRGDYVGSFTLKPGSQILPAPYSYDCTDCGMRVTAFSPLPLFGRIHSICPSYRRG